MSSDFNIYGLFKFTIGNRQFLQSFLIFLVLFISVLFLGETSTILLLISIFNFGLFAFFKIQSIIIASNKNHNNMVNYIPLGNPTIISSRFFKITIIQIITILGMGIESIIHPQLIDNYFIIYIIILGILQIFLLFYLFYDIALYSKIEIQIKNENNNMGGVSPTIVNLTAKNKLLSYLKINEFKQLFFEVKFIFILLESAWFLLAILSRFVNLIPIQLVVPGSSLPEGTAIQISLIPMIIIYIVPVLAIFYFRKVYYKINSINPIEINPIIEQMPKIEQEKIRKTLNFYLGI